MAVVTLGLFVIFLVAVILVIGAAGTSAGKRQRASARQDREDEERRKMEEEMALLHVSGQPLMCLGCQKTFVGPMQEDGCPDCHISSLVVPVRTRKSRSKKAG